MIIKEIDCSLSLEYDAKPLCTSLHSGKYRGIAQSGSAPALGAGCRGFESLYPDQLLFTG